MSDYNKYKIEGYKIKLLKTLIVGNKLKGMSHGKVFVRDDGNYYINLDDKLHKITKLKVTNKNGEEIKNLNKVGFDTDKSVRGVLVCDKKLLLHYRIKKGREYYVFPGGHIWIHESPEETLVREFKEETGLDVKVGNLFLKLTQEGFSEERFYKVALIRPSQKLFKQNPDVKKGEVNKPVWVRLVDCKKLSILPEEVIKKILNED